MSRSVPHDAGHPPARPPGRTLAAFALAGLFLLGSLLSAPLGAKKTPVPEALPEQYRQFLKSVEVLMTDEERDAFLKLEADYQRDAFIVLFWRIRDPDPSTPRNELRDQWEEVAARVEAEFQGELDDRGRMLMINGPPAAMFEGTCPGRLYPVEVWYYERSWAVGHELVLVFYRRHGAGPFRLFHPADGLGVLSDPWGSMGRRGAVDLQQIALSCPNGDKLAAAIAWALRQGTMGFDSLLAQMESAREEPSGEWVATFDAYSTQVPAGAATFDAELEVTFPGRRQSRTVTQGLIVVAADAVGQAELGGAGSYNLVLNGEVLRQGELFESFRYKFDFPASQVRGGTIPLVFERALRPEEEYTLLVKVEDLNSGRFFRAERAIVVPRADGPPPALEPMDSTTARLLAEANALLAEGESSLKLVQPRGELLTRMVRFDALVTGEVQKVAFALNGQTVFTDGRPPFTVEFDLGDLPRTHTVRAIGYDAAGRELVSDEVLINAGGTRFRAWLLEPRRDRTYEDSFRARVELEVPDGEDIERVELYLDETRIATLYGEPWVQPIVLPEELRGRMAFVRAVAYLDDGNSTEDTVFINAPAYMEELDVQFVELYTTVLDRAGRPVQGLTREEFRVLEGEQEQEILRFEQVRDLPIHAGILLDVSASMGESQSLGPAREAALQFFQQILRPKDRAAVVTFNDRPNLAVQFTNDVATLAGGLAGLKAERGTALWDSTIFSLYYFNGIKGQKALLVLSDGKDESSRFAFENALEYAHRAGVTIYAVGLSLPKGEDRRKLSRIAEETGGRSFFIDSTDALAGIYSQVEEELRSQYLIAYQSATADTSGAFRKVDLRVRRPDLEAKTMTGYYP
ncbi:MAG TPA: VWA domain-containing protein [Thermoanaerobaculia bacterium]|nr:VWA domain-containing protein [Thermoanaerobaculia bacterium]